MDTSEDTLVLALTQPEIYYNLPIISLTMMTQVCHNLAKLCRRLRDNLGFWRRYAKLHPRDVLFYDKCANGAEMELLYALGRCRLLSCLQGNKYEWFPLLPPYRALELLKSAHVEAGAYECGEILLSVIITYNVSEEIVIAYIDTFGGKYCTDPNSQATAALVLNASDAVYLHMRRYAKGPRLDRETVKDQLISNSATERYLHLAAIDEELPKVTDMRGIVWRITSVSVGRRLTPMMKLYPLATKISHDNKKHRHTPISVIVIKMLHEPVEELFKLLREWDVMTTMASGALLVMHLLKQCDKLPLEGPASRTLRELLMMLVPLLMPIPAKHTVRSKMITYCPLEDERLLGLLNQQLSK